MNDKEKKAIDFLKFWSNDDRKQIKAIEKMDCDYYDEEKNILKYRTEQIDILLNLIQNQEKEIKDLKFKNEVYKKKAKIDEKVIDEMAYQLAGLAIWDNQKEEAFVLGDVEEVKQYFYGKVQENG